MWRWEDRMNTTNIDTITNALFSDDEDDVVVTPPAAVPAQAVVEAVDLAEDLETPLDHAHAFAKAIMGEGQLHGVRVLYTSGKEVALTREGLFSDARELAKAVIVESDKKEKVFHHGANEQKYPAGVYILPNPQKRSILAKMDIGSMKVAPKGDSISDSDIERRQVLLIDIDSIKDGGVKGISATEEESQQAVNVGDEIVTLMASLGWHKPIRCFSGNGAHILYRIDLENNEDSKKLVNSVLMSIKNTFKENKSVDIDTTVSNAARIWKMPGTLARKGKNTEDRPHRLARVTSLPSDWRSHVVTAEQLKAFVVSNGDDKAKSQIGIEIPRSTTALATRGKSSVATTQPSNPADFTQVNEQMIADQRWLPDLLETLSASTERNQWLSTMRAIRGLDPTNAGMDLFQQWSKGHDTSYGDMTAMSDWTSLAGDDPAKAIQVLMSRAKESGWTYRDWCKRNGVTHPKSKARKAQEEIAIQRAASISQDTMDIMSQLLMSQGKDPRTLRPLSTDGNHYTIVKLDQNLTKTFCYDGFTRCVMVMNSGNRAGLSGPFPREIAEEDYITLSEWMQGAYQMSASAMNCRAAIDAVSRLPMNRFDSLRDKMLSLKWDGVKRLDTFGVEYLNVEDTTFNQYATKRFMIGAAARALDDNPNGTKVDTCLILEGLQGFYKSEAVRLLSYHLYSNNVNPDPENKDNFLNMRRVFLVEFGEFEKYMVSNRSDGKLKDFMSTNVDTYRAPYKSQTESFNRRVSFVGTTNEEGYLKDPTGNRRYWPVKVMSRINLEKLERDRDQLWAEAVECVRDFQEAKEDGVPNSKNANRWWFEESDECSAQAAVVSARVVSDPWEDVLGSKLKSADKTTVKECFEILGIAVENQDPRKQERVLVIIKMLGFQKKAVWSKEQKRKVNGWVRSES